MGLVLALSKLWVRAQSRDAGKAKVTCQLTRPVSISNMVLVGDRMVSKRYWRHTLAETATSCYRLQIPAQLMSVSTAGAASAALPCTVLVTDAL